MFKLTGPNPMWRNEADCGEATFKRPDGTVIPLNCAGPAHLYFRDLDGTLLAGGAASGRGTQTGFFPAPRVFEYDQGTPVLPGPCTYSSVLDSYTCAENSTAFLLDERLKPSPMPPKGIFGDPQLFVLEVRGQGVRVQGLGPSSCPSSRHERG